MRVRNKWGELNHRDTEARAGWELRRMTAKEALLELVAEMCEEDAARLLGLANRFYDDEALSDYEREELFRIQDEMKAGNFVTLEELDRRLGL